MGLAGSRRTTIAPTIRNGAVTTTMKTLESSRPEATKAATISEARPVAIATAANGHASRLARFEETRTCPSCTAVLRLSWGRRPVRVGRGRVLPGLRVAKEAGCRALRADVVQRR